MSKKKQGRNLIYLGRVISIIAQLNLDSQKTIDDNWYKRRVVNGTMGKDIEIAQGLRDQGLSLRQIAKIIGRSREWVRQKTYDTQDFSRAPSLSLILGAELVKQCGISTPKAATLVGCSQTSLYRFIEVNHDYIWQKQGISPDTIEWYYSPLGEALTELDYYLLGEINKQTLLSTLTRVKKFSPFSIRRLHTAGLIKLTIIPKDILVSKA